MPIRFTNGRPWTPAEDALLRERYFGSSAAALAAEINRTQTAVWHRLHRIGVIKNRAWTPEDDEQLRLLWGECPLPQLAAQIGRTPATTYWRAQSIGLPLGCPQGHEYLSAAAKRTGYGTAQLRQILNWVGVAIKMSMARPTGPRERVFHVVVPYDVDQAIATWHATEPLDSAARRRGTTSDRLARRLRLVPGVPKKPRGRRHWRIPSDLIDMALATPLPKPNRPRGAHGYFVARGAA